MYLFSIKESYFNIILVFTPIESTSVEKVSIKKLHLIDELKMYLPMVINRFLEFMKCTLKMRTGSRYVQDVTLVYFVNI